MLFRSFFAGEPIDDISPGPKANRLLIKMQRWGTSIDVNDTLYIDLQNSLEIARCLRGTIVNGVPDWNTRDGWCDWSGGTASGDGGGAGDAAATDAGDGADAGDAGADAGDAGGMPTRARIRFSAEGPLRASLTLLFTCHPAEGPVNVVGMAVGGWIDFVRFGGVLQPDLPPDLRGAIDHQFKANFGDRLRANFHMDLGDQRVLTARKLLDPIPAPLIGGALDGFFDFVLERGRAAQPFP